MWRKATGGEEFPAGGGRLRPTLGKKLGVAFLLMMAMTAASLLIARLLYNTVADAPALVNESGRLRYLSQQIAYRSTGVVHSARDREALLQLVGEYDRKLSEIEGKCQTSFPAGGELTEALVALRRDWDAQRMLVDQLAKVESVTQAQLPQQGVQRGADVLLARADKLVGALVGAARLHHRRIDAVIYLTLAANLVFLAVVFHLIRRTVSEPIVEASRALRRFAAGDRQARLATRSNDELGDLGHAFNRTAEQTGSLIVELATKSAILDETSDFVGTMDTAGRFLYVNRAGLKMLGREAGAAGLRLEDAFPAWASALMRDVGFPAAAAHGAWSGETALLADAAGNEIPISQVIVAHRAQDGTLAYFSTIARDISDRIGMEDRLTQSRDFYLKLFHDFPNPIWRSGTDARCNYFNKAWLDFTGRSLIEEIEGGWGLGVHADDAVPCAGAYREAFAARRPFELVYRLRRHDGEYRWIVNRGAPFFDMDGEFAGFIGTCHDITERKRYEDQLEFQATHDALTGLPNRNLLADRLQQAIVHAGRERRSAAVLFVDLDQFKFVNDSLGHEIGDRLLAAAAERLRSTVRQGDTVARQGGDEFVIVLADIARIEGVIEVAQKLLQCLQAPFVVDDHELFVTASIGISVYPQDGADIHTLLRNADMAMYRAKEEGRNSFEFFTADMNATVLERLSLESSLRRALEREELQLHYQPQVDLASGQIIGMEALLRWHHPELGLVPPVKFIPLAEETGLIVAIGAWVLRKACAQNRAWQDAGLPPVMVAVNLSARQFGQSDIVEMVRRALAETALEPRFLELELTESTIMRDPEHVVAVLRRLSEMGVQLSIDDFGTGYSSLNYLKRFPIDKIKIDRSFVRDITVDPDDAAIAKTIVSIAHDMRLKVIAEGTETEGQVNVLRGFGCDGIQGYLFSPPLPADGMEKLLRERRRLPVPADEMSKRTLLLVDDEPSVTNALVRLLRPDGYRILRADGGAAALELLAVNKVGVILSDQRMPGMSGVELLRRAKDLYPNTVRMVLSGYTELKSVTEAINEGAVYKFLTKPWDDAMLRDQVREAFQRFELRAENARLANDLAAANERLSAAKGVLETEVAHSVGALRVSQEMFDLLPVGALGLDDEGCVVVANSKAERILAAAGQPLIGAVAADRLPAPMVECIGRVISSRAADGGLWRSPHGAEFAFQCHAMGAASCSQGAVLTLVPVSGIADLEAA